MTTPWVTFFRGTSLIVVLFLLIGCDYSKRKPRHTNLPHGNHVEYRNGAKILTQRFAERDEIHYYLSDLKLRPTLLIRGSAGATHDFELGSSASGKLSTRPPEKLVFELTHEVARRRDWHFPESNASEDFSKPNASFDISIVADGQTVQIARNFQSELKKDDPSDATFYETIITEISREDFTRIANSRAVKVNLGSFASFDLDDQTIAVLKYFAETVNDTEPWP